MNIACPKCKTDCYLGDNEIAEIDADDEGMVLDYIWHITCPNCEHNFYAIQTYVFSDLQVEDDF